MCVENYRSMTVQVYFVTRYLIRAISITPTPLSAIIAPIPRQLSISVLPSQSNWIFHKIKAFHWTVKYYEAHSLFSGIANGKNCFYGLD